MAGGSGSLTLDPDAARDLGELLGVDATTASSKTFHDTVKSLTDSHSIQMADSQRYTQVRTMSLTQTIS
jgi:hypothetical protein